MTAPAPLDELIQEAERLDREATEAAGTGGIAAYTAAAFYITHGRRLVAVAKAAVEIRKTYGKLASLHSVESGVPTYDVDADGELVQTGRTPDIDNPDCEHCRVLAAFDRAAGEQGNG